MFRKADIEDIDYIIKVMHNTTYAQYIYPGKSLSELKRIISESMKNRTYLVCVESKKIIGYFIIDSLNNHLPDTPRKIKLNRKYAYHAGVGIHSDFRGKGLAKKFTKYAFKIAKQKGFTGMYADVASNNDISIKLQEKCGFKELVRYNSKWRPKGIKNVVFGIKF